jgi:tRNA (cytidine/uridine-2'-O-)-methyltransferase
LLGRYQIDEIKSSKDACNRHLLTSMFHVALYEPEIPPNTGNVARLCAAAGASLHIVGVTGFRMDDRTLKRAGLDYWDHVNLTRHVDMPELEATLRGSRLFYLTTKSDQPYWDVIFKPGDCLVFGPETRGLPEPLLDRNRSSAITIPMMNPAVRSLNLATSVGIVLYEAIRQQQ